MEESLMGSKVEGMSNIPDIICNAYGYEKHDAGEYSPLTLAYIGDTIYDLIVRTKVIMAGNAPVNKLHKRASAVVNATAQAVCMGNIYDKLTEEEQGIYRRGKNAKSYTTAKNASVKDYHIATGFETLIGWLYLKGNMERIYELVLPEIEEKKV